MNTLFEKLLVLKNFGKIVFDRNFNVLEANPIAVKILRLDSGKKTFSTLFELFPEFYGCEKALAQLFSSEKDCFELHFVNRIDKENRNYYINLSAFADVKNSRGILIVEEVSEKAQFLQQLRQQRHELSLYRALSGIPEQFFKWNTYRQFSRNSGTKAKYSKIKQNSGRHHSLNGGKRNGKKSGCSTYSPKFSECRCAIY